MAFGNALTPPYGNPHPAQTSQTNQWSWISSDAWNPQNGYGYWTWGTVTRSQHTTWVDTPTHTGVLTVMGMPEGKFSGTIQSSPAPATNAATFDTVLFTDGSSLKTGDVLNVQVDTPIRDNCSGTADAEVLSVAGNRVTFKTTMANAPSCSLSGQISGTCPADQTPLVGGAVIGGVYYCNASIKTTRWRHRWMVWDPADLVTVIQGGPSYAPIPKYEWNVAYDGLLDPEQGINGSYFHNNIVTWDPIAKQVLVAIDDASGPPNHIPRVFVHSIP
jgi:hypothetical protein